MKFKNIINNVGLFFVKQAPAIATATGIGCMITGTILAVKATPKALAAIDKAREEKGEPLTKMEVVKAGVKSYIPAIAFTAVGCGAIVTGLTKSVARTSAAVTAAQITEKAFDQYKEIVESTVSEEDKTKIGNKMAEVTPPTTIVSTSDTPRLGGTQLCKDTLTGRYFYSSPAYIDKCVETFNQQIKNQEYEDPFATPLNMNDLYTIIGLDEVDAGELIRFNKAMCETRYNPGISDDNTTYLNVHIIGYLMGT